MMAHTPGPWVASHYLDTNEIGVISHTNRIVVGLSSRLTEDDARLIAAAPELLTILKEWRGLHRGCVQDTDKDADFEARCQLCVDSDTAIVKATGGA